MQPTVRILFLGPLAEQARQREVEMRLEGVSTLSEVLRRLRSESMVGEALRDWPRESSGIVVSVDGEVVRDEKRELKGGETIIISPMLAGGSQAASVRCLNCSNRIEVPEKAEEVSCPSCNTRYQITWITPKQPKIRRVE